MTNDEIIQAAIEFARHNKKYYRQGVERNQKTYPPEESPFSNIHGRFSRCRKRRNFRKILSRPLKVGAEKPIVRIDGDEIRNRLPGYIPATTLSYFKGPISIIGRQDPWTLSGKKTDLYLPIALFRKYEKAKKNIERSLDPLRRIDLSIYSMCISVQKSRGYLLKRENNWKADIFQCRPFIDEFIQAKKRP